MEIHVRSYPIDMNKTFLCILSLFALTSATFGQDAKTLDFKLIDKTDRRPIVGAHISCNGFTTTTDKSGIASIKNHCDTIQISHISYGDTILALAAIEEHTIRLTKRHYSLKGVRIDNKPYEVFSPRDLHVFDFTFIGDTLLALTCEREKLWRRQSEQSKPLYVNCKLMVVTPNGNIAIRRNLRDFTESFFTDGLGQTFIVQENRVLLVSLRGDQICLEPLDRPFFEEQIAPLKMASSTHYFFDDQEWDYPAFTHYSKSIKTGEIAEVKSIQDDFVMELFRAEYKYMDNRSKLQAIRMETDTGIDKEIIGAYMSRFQNSPYYTPPVAPLFSLGDTIAIFDHPKKTIHLLAPDGTMRDSLTMQFTENGPGKYREEIVRDPVQNKVYAIYLKNGKHRLGRIELSSGKCGDTKTLYYPFVEKIKVQKDKVYYLYRRDALSETTHLFAEDL